MVVVLLIVPAQICTETKGALKKKKKALARKYANGLKIVDKGSSDDHTPVTIEKKAHSLR